MRYLRKRARKLATAVLLALMLATGGVGAALADDMYCPCRVCRAEYRFGWHYVEDNSWLGGYWAYGEYIEIRCTVE